MYKHKQVGWLIIGVFTPVVLALSIWVVYFPVIYAIITAIFLFLTMLFFSSLTVVADQAALTFYFGPGLIKRKFLYSDIVKFEKVRNRWYYGWGIHWFGRGWLYNVSGFDAVEISLKNGTVVRIGTDEVDTLYNYVASRIRTE